MYKLNQKATIVTRLSDGACIPLPPNESNGYEYQEWLAAGNTPQPADIPVKVYQPLSAWQVRKVLTVSGLRAQVEAAILTATQEIQDAWNHAAFFEIDDPILVALATLIGLTRVQLEGLFDLGITL